MPPQPSKPNQGDATNQAQQSTVYYRPNEANSVSVVSGSGPSTFSKPKRANKLKIVLIALAAVILVGCIAMAALYFLLGNDAASNTSGADQASSTGQPAANQESVANHTPSAEISASEDNARRYDLSRYFMAVEEYWANNNGKLPDNSAALLAYLSINPFLGRPAIDPTTNEAYALVDEVPKIGQIQYKPGVRCDGSELLAAAANQFAVRTLLSNGSMHCIDR